VIVVFLLAGLSFSSQASEFCAEALRRSESLSSEQFSNLKVHIKRGAIQDATELGLSKNQLETLARQSQVKSFQRGGREIWLLFHTVKTKHKYRDYVLEATIHQRYIPGQSKSVNLLRVSKLSQRREGDILHELAANESVVPHQLQVSGLDFRALGFPRGLIQIDISPKVRIKLRFKHRIDLKLLAEILSHPPDQKQISAKSADLIELIYRSPKGSLLVVLAMNHHKPSLDLVTAFFFRGNER